MRPSGFIHHATEISNILNTYLNNVAYECMNQPHTQYVQHAMHDLQVELFAALADQEKTEARDYQTGNRK